MNDSWPRVLALAERQHSVFSLAQAASFGVSRRFVDHRTSRGELARVHPGVVRVVGARETFAQRAMAATLWLGDRSALSHTSAARILRLDGGADATLHLSVPNGETRGRRANGIRVHRTMVLPDRHRTFVGTVACTSAPRTLVDAAAMLDDEALEAAAESARRMGIMTVGDLERVLHEVGQHRAGVGKLRRYVEQNRGQPALQYKLEVKLDGLLRATCLGPFVRQHRVRVESGAVYRVDFARPEVRFAVEAEGFRWHGSHLQWKRDRLRTAAIEAAGWRLMFVTWDDVTRLADQTLERIAGALAGAQVVSG
jgi:very-short-patch-repair endonuclease